MKTFFKYLGMFSLIMAFYRAEIGANESDAIASYVTEFEIYPSSKAGYLTLIISTNTHEKFELSNLEWNDLAALNIKIGDSITYYKKELDYSNYGKPWVEIAFNSNIILQATGESTGAYLYINNLIEDENHYKFNVDKLDIATREGDDYPFPSHKLKQWSFEKNLIEKLQIDQPLFIDYTSEEFIPDYIEKSIYTAYSTSGEMIGPVIGDSIKNWEPTVDDRIFTVAEMISDTSTIFYGYVGAMLQHPSSEQLEHLYDPYFRIKKDITGHKLLLVYYNITQKTVFDGYLGHYKTFPVAYYAFYDLNTQTIFERETAFLNPNLSADRAYKVAEHVPAYNYSK